MKGVKHEEGKGQRRQGQASLLESASTAGSGRGITTCSDKAGSETASPLTETRSPSPTVSVEPPHAARGSESGIPATQRLPTGKIVEVVREYLVNTPAAESESDRKLRLQRGTPEKIVSYTVVVVR